MTGKWLSSDFWAKSHLSVRSRPGKPNQRKGQTKSSWISPIFLWTLVFFLGKTSTIHIELLFRNAPAKSSWTGLSLVWFAGVTPDLRARKSLLSHFRALEEWFCRRWEVILKSLSGHFDDLGVLGSVGASVDHKAMGPVLVPLPLLAIRRAAGGLVVAQEVAEPLPSEEVPAYKTITWSGCASDAAFLFLQLEASCLQWSFFTYSWQFQLFCLQLALFDYKGKVHLIRALRDCKQRSLTVSKKAPTLSRKASPPVHRVVADVWEKDVWQFQAKSGSSGSCRLFLHFLGKIAGQ